MDNAGDMLIGEKQRSEAENLLVLATSQGRSLVFNHEGHEVHEEIIR